MQSKEQISSILKDMIVANNNRVKGYEKAVDETTTVDIDLHAIFNSMANDSRRYVSDLIHEVIILGGESAKTNHPEKILSEWLGGTKPFTKSDRQTILTSCDYGEEATQKAYTEALSSIVGIDSKIRKMLNDQQASLKIAHSLIKKYGGFLVDVSL